VKFEHNPFNCRTLGATIGQIDLRVWGPRCTWFAADKSPDIDAIHYCLPHFKPECSECEWGQKVGQYFALFDSPVINREGLVERSVRIIHATPWF